MSAIYNDMACVPMNELTSQILVASNLVEATMLNMTTGPLTTFSDQCVAVCCEAGLTIIEAGRA